MISRGLTELRIVNLMLGVAGILCIGTLYAVGEHVPLAEELLGIGNKADTLTTIGVLAIVSTLSILGNIWLTRKILEDKADREDRLVAMMGKLTHAVDQLAEMKRAVLTPASQIRP